LSQWPLPLSLIKEPKLMPVSPIAKQLAAKISPSLQAAANARKEDIIHNAGGLPVRAVVRVGFPVAVREIPPLAESGCDVLFDHLGTLSIGDVARMLVQHNEAKGRDPHPSVPALLLTHS
jgi:hypothetical protein